MATRTEKIFAAESPAPPEDLFERIDALAAAADAEDGERVVELLRQTVPHYQTPQHDGSERPVDDSQHVETDRP